MLPIVEPIGVLIALIVSAFSAGALAMLYDRLHATQALLMGQVEEFRRITKEASAANLSLAEKMMELEKRVESTEFHQNLGGKR